MALIKGILKNAFGEKMPDHTILFTALRTNQTVLNTVVSVIKTDSNGSYEKNLYQGRYQVDILKDGIQKTTVGILEIFSDSPDADINTYLTLPDVSEVTPEFIQQVIELKNEAIQAANSALLSEEKVKTYSDSAMESASAAKESENNSLNIKNEVLSKSQEVSNNSLDVSNKHSEVVMLSNQVSTDAANVSNDKKSTEDAAISAADSAENSKQKAEEAKGYSDSIKESAQQITENKNQISAVSLKTNKIISEDLVINVPGDFPGPAEAMDYLRNYSILSGANVLIKIADSNYTLDRSVNLNHQQGSQISMIGNQSDKTKCKFTCADTDRFDGFYCSGGYKFGLLDGVYVTRPSKAEMPYNTTGILSLKGSSIILGDNIKVDNWFYSISARDHSFLFCQNADASHAGDVGIWSFCNSLIVCNGAKSTFVSAENNDWGFGFQAEFGSVLVGSNIIAENCKIAGIAALSNSTLRLESAISRMNQGSGYFARDGGVIEGSGSSSKNNSRYGVEVLGGNGEIYGISDISGNAMGNINPFAYVSSLDGQSKIGSSVGPLRIDSGGPTYFNTPGGLQFSVEDIAGAVNRLSISGAVSGSGVRLQAMGTDDNIDLKLITKGSGKIMVGATSAKPSGFETNSIIEFYAADGALIQLPVKRF